MSPGTPDPFASFGAFTQGIAGLEQLERIRRGFLVHTTAPRPPVGLTPHEVIHTHDKLSVRYYAPARPQGLLPVVLVPSLINRAYILDLEPDRSLVRALSQLGHPVYLIDWGEPGIEDADEDLAYVLFDLLHRSMDRARRHAGAQKLILLGYCMGGILAAMIAALRPQRVAGLVCLNTPARFSAGGRFHDFVDPAHLDVHTAFPPGTLVPVETMKPAFKMLDPMGNWSKYLGIEAASREPKALARAMARERWLEENVPVSSAFARDLIQYAYQEDRLLAGTWELRGERVDLRRADMPSLVVCCKKDFIAPPESTKPLAEALGRAELVELDVGHIAVVVGSFAPKVFYPLLDKWFRKVGAA